MFGLSFSLLRIPPQVIFLFCCLTFMGGTVGETAEMLRSFLSLRVSSPVFFGGDFNFVEGFSDSSSSSVPSSFFLDLWSGVKDHLGLCAPVHEEHTYFRFRDHVGSCMSSRLDRFYVP